MPPIPPANFKVEVDSHTKLRASWDRLTPEEAQGFVVSYTVFYKKEESQQDEGMEKSVPGTENSLFIENLDSNQGYSLMVWANTTVGMGQPSQPISTKSMYFYSFSSGMYSYFG